MLFREVYSFSRFLFFFIFFVSIYYLPWQSHGIFSWKNTEAEDVNEKNNTLNDDQIEKIIDCWINLHRDKFDSIEKKPVTVSLKNWVYSYLEISIRPKNKRSLPLKFEIGGQVNFVIRIERTGPKQYIYGLEFDTENGGGYDNVSRQQLEDLLQCYLEGDYYATDLMIDDKVIAHEFHMKNEKVDYADHFGNPCFFEKMAATQKQFKFDHL